MVRAVVAALAGLMLAALGDDEQEGLTDLLRTLRIEAGDFAEEAAAVPPARPPG